MGKPSAPKPPDPKETSAAQTGTNVSTAIANAMMGNVNQVTPDGTLSFDQNGSYSWTDPYTNEVYDVPTFTATQTLSDQGQAVRDQQDRADLNLSTLAADQSGFLGDYMSEPFSYDPGQHEGWALGLYDKLNSDNLANQEDSLRTRLSQQGIKEGSEAFDRAMGEMRDTQGSSRNRFMLDAYGQGMQTALSERNQPINEITALLSGSQVSQPQFVNANMPSIPTTDNAGLIMDNYNQRLNIWNQENAAKQSMMGGLFGLAAGGLSGGYF